jgi:hypothetical protein
MTNEQKTEWDKIERSIYEAFKGITLDSGIGYYEAEALDNYLIATNEKYQQQKAKDERQDWIQLVSIFKDVSFDCFPHSFMDAKGLRFYLPLLMIRKENTLNNILHVYISELYQRSGYLPSEFTKTVALLTKEQKNCIYSFYHFLNKINYPDFTNEELNVSFDTGEKAMQGFDFMIFLEKQFKTK